MLSLELILLFLSFGPIEHENMKTRSDLTFARRAIKLKFYVQFTSPPPPIKVVYVVPFTTSKYVTESGLVLSALHQKTIAYNDCLYKGGTQIN